MRGARIYLIAHSYAVDMVHPEYVIPNYRIVDFLVQSSERHTFPDMLENAFLLCNISSKNYRRDGKRNTPRPERHEYADVERRCILVCSFGMFAFTMSTISTFFAINKQEIHNNIKTLLKHQNDGNQ